MIELNTSKRIGSLADERVLKVSFTALKGEITTLFGPSGVGKSTVLRMIAGLTAPENGFISFNCDFWFHSEKKINVAIQNRSIGFLFQDFALFPNMTVIEQLYFAQRSKNKEEIESLLEQFGLQNLSFRKVNLLSGGEKQRVAFARALAGKPDILLLDEPLTSVDVEKRYKLQDDLINLTRNSGIVTIVVSHDLAEVMKLSDSVVTISEKGIAEQFSKDEFTIKCKQDFSFLL